MSWGRLAFGTPAPLSPLQRAGKKSPSVACERQNNRSADDDGESTGDLAESSRRPMAPVFNVDPDNSDAPTTQLPEVWRKANHGRVG